MTVGFRLLLVLTTMLGMSSTVFSMVQDAHPFGPEFPDLDSDATGEWWKPVTTQRGAKKGQVQEPRLLVPRSEVVAFALYTHDAGTLKLSAQLYPLKPDEPRRVVLEFHRGDAWVPAAEAGRARDDEVRAGGFGAASAAVERAVVRQPEPPPSTSAPDSPSPEPNGAGLAEGSPSAG